jgi:pimeloyl-ACP methyl ester carboxylesterase
MPGTIYALLVGIDHYPSPVPQLAGCINDINAIEKYLNERIDLQRYNLAIVKLLDEQATRQAVIQNFQQHFSQAKQEDIVLFYYSGHGSQEPAPPEFWHLEPDRMNETLVCWDSRTSAWDLADKELGYLIAEVAKTDPHIVIILDCCHSGSGTRDIVPERGVRHAPADRRARTINDFIFPLPALEAIQSMAQTSADRGEASGWNIPQGRHILLSGCRDSELASEYSGDGQQRGAFSYFLLDSLQKINGSLTYRELFKRLNALVRSRIKDQTPQLEATLQSDLEMPFLGSDAAIARRDPYYTLSYERNRWVIDGGAVHGIAPNTQLALYPLGTPTEQMRQVSAAVGEAEVVDVLPHQSEVEITPGDLPSDTVLNAVITSLPLPPLGIYFEGDTTALNLVRQELALIGMGGQGSLYIREVNDSTQAQYRLLAEDNQYLITKPSDRRPLVRQLEGYTNGNARQVLDNLEHMARWTAVVQLEGTPGSRIPADAVKMQFYLADGTETVDSTLRLSYQYRDGKWQYPIFRLKLTNTSEERLFCTVLDLPEDYSVSAPLFEGNNRGVWIEPGTNVWAYRKRDIPASVPDDLWSQGVTEYQDILKLIVSTAEFDASLISQNGLEQPKLTQRPVPQRNSTLNRLFQRVTTRHIGVVQVDEVDEWVTSQVTVITIRPRDTAAIQSNTSVRLGMGVTVLPHPSLQATARLTTVAQSTRDVGQILPPILRDNTQPFQFTASRGVDPGLSALELKVPDANSLNAVTREQPLTLVVDKALAENEYVLPIAYDGEFFIPLGRGELKDGKTEIRLERLPDPLEAKRRSLGGSIRIFFQKVITEKLGLDFPYPILAAVDYGDEAVQYTGEVEAVKQKVATANKIVLFIHGIIGDTQSIVPCVRLAHVAIDGQAKPLTEIYDLVLAFDYENLNTPIGTLAEQLGQRLQAVGLGANHGKTLHLVAHSMGGLVSRSFIEQKSGNQVVQHLIMLGTPNAGSPWSTVQDWALTALTAGLNGLTVSGFPLAVLGHLLQAIEAIDINLDQMKPGSDFLTALRDSTDPGVPYTILAGNTSLVSPPDPATESKLQALLRKLGRGAMEFPFLGQPNDIAVTVESIKSVPQAQSHKPHIQEVACNHLVYFSDPAGLAALGHAIAHALNVPSEPKPPAPATVENPEPDSDLSEPKSQTGSWIVGFMLLAIAVATLIILWPKTSQRPQSQPSSSLQLPNQFS